MQQHLAFLGPLQILVLTHELSDLSSTDTLDRVAEHFYPVLPVAMYGRTAALGSQVKKEETVWYGWRDLRACMYTDHVTYCSSKGMCSSLVVEYD